MAMFEVNVEIAPVVNLHLKFVYPLQNMTVRPSSTSVGLIVTFTTQHMQHLIFCRIGIMGHCLFTPIILFKSWAFDLI